MLFFISDNFICIDCTFVVVVEFSGKAVVLLAVELATTIIDCTFAVVVEFSGKAVVLLAVEIATTILDSAAAVEET